MARYALIADIHGNLAALRRVLEQLDREGIDRVLCLGDLVGYCPEPDECVDELQRRRIDAIAGNHDLIAGGRLDTSRCAPKAAFALRRTRRALAPRTALYLRGLPHRLEYEEGFVLVHGDLGDPQRYLRTATAVAASAARLRREQPRVRVCFYGHTHDPRVWEIDAGRAVEVARRGAVALRPDRLYYVNPGSVDASRKRSAPEAQYAVYDPEAGRVELRSVPYDGAAVEAKARRLGYRLGPLTDLAYAVGRRLRRAPRAALRRLGAAPHGPLDATGARR